MKRKWFLFTVMSVTILLLAACSNEKGLSIKTRILTEDEEMLIMNAGGATVEHFEIVGDIPEGYYLDFVVEGYENGKFIHDWASMPLESELMDDRGIGFGYRIDAGANQDTLIFGTPGGGATMSIESLQGASSSSSMIDEDVVIKPNKPVYLAYVIRSVDGHISGGFTEENDFADLKENDQCFLLKAELKKE